ncbi:MAG TPA: tetratricopeptide repeat protein [Kiritimatiellia bacterium]|nr:tetratricopeptide repeat protein [Kiritimatiellia bacterium]
MDMDNPSTPPAPFPWPRLATALALGVLALVVFLPAAGFDFLNLDDLNYVADNEHVNTGLSWANVKWAFSSAHENWWLPLLWLSYMADSELFGPGPFGYHLVNVLLHALNTALLFWALWRMTGSAARSAFVAALFAVHPQRVEAVAWITSRKDVLSGLFYLLSLLAYLRCVERPTLARRLLLPVLMLLGLMSKAILITLPPVLLLLDYWPLKRAGDPLDRREWKKWGALFMEKLPLVMLALVFVVVNLHTHTTGRGLLLPFPLSIRLGLMPPNYWAFLGKLFWPARLAIVYPEADLVNGGVTAAALAGLAAATGLVLRLRRRQPWLLVGWSWFLVALLPVIRGLRMGIAGMADRFTYIPGIGLFILLAWGVSEALPPAVGKKALLGGLAAAAVAACLVATRQYLSCWKDSETLFPRSIAVTKDNYVLWLNLAGAHQRKGRLDEEIECLRKGLDANPLCATLHVLLGQAYDRKGRPAAALAEFEQAARLALPFEAHNHAVVGERFARAGRYEEAIRHLDVSLQADPASIDTRRNLGLAHLFAGHPQEALSCFQEVIRRAPQDDRAYFLMGKILLSLQRGEEAIRALRAAAERAPDKVETRSLLAVALGRAGRMKEATALLRAALSTRPNSPELLNNLAWLLAARPGRAGHDPKAALAYALRAAEITGRRNPDILDTLALAQAADGQYDAAVETLQEAERKAEAEGIKDFPGRIALRIEAYRAGRPWQEEP